MLSKRVEVPREKRFLYALTNGLEAAAEGRHETCLRDTEIDKL